MVKMIEDIKAAECRVGNIELKFFEDEPYAFYVIYHEDEDKDEGWVDFSKRGYPYEVFKMIGDTEQTKEFIMDITRILYR